MQDVKLLPEETRPMFPCRRRPEEILGQNYDLFCNHLRTWHRCNGSELLIARSFSESDRVLIGHLNQELFLNGFRVDSISEAGKITWSVITVSKEADARFREIVAMSQQSPRVRVRAGQILEKRGQKV